ncbi:MAG: sialidase family protein [Actinomycetota bacterium]
MACAVRTGYGSSETRVGVTKSGAVVFQPAIVPTGPGGLGFVPGAPGPSPQTNASPAGLAVSHNLGASWSLIKPLGMTWQGNDAQIYIDRRTGRLFWYDFTPSPAGQDGLPPAQQYPIGLRMHLLWSADDGRTWTHSSSCCPAILFAENPRFVAAPPTREGPRPVGYPNVLYFCANSNIGIISPPIVARRCSRSLDGGTTWTVVSILFSKPVPQHSECGPNGEDFGALDGNYPQAGPGGSLYVMIMCGGKTYLAKSTDQAVTWPIIRNRDGTPRAIPAAAPESPAGSFEHVELRTDGRGNLYLAQTAGTSLMLQVSRDEGRTWSRPQDVTAPRVFTVGTWNFAVRGRGHVAFSYYGQRAGQETWDGYLTETRDALEVLSGGRPVFWSAQLNDPARPLMYSDDQTRGTLYVNVDFIGVDIGPDGTPWASFVEDCGPNPSDPTCRAQRHQTRGFAGRFLWSS